jgi:hypothetical protein
MYEKEIEIVKRESYMQQNSPLKVEKLSLSI